MVGGSAEEFVHELKGVMNIAPTLNVSTSNSLWGLQPDNPLTDRQEHDPFNVWRETNGGTVQRSGAGYELATDPAQTNSEGVLETARLGLYRPGNMGSVGGSVVVQNRPTGDGSIDAGYLLDGTADGFVHRITADDLQGHFRNLTNGVEFTVSRSAGEMEKDAVTTKTDGNGDPVAKVYGIDPMDGEGISNIEWDPAHGYIYGFLIGWYGTSTVTAFIKAVGERARERVYDVWPMYMVEPVGGPLFQIPNRPYHVRTSNGTTAEEVSARVLGRQYQTFGDSTESFRPVFATAEDQTIPMDGTGYGDRDWYVVAVGRRKPTDVADGKVISLEDFEVASDAEAIAIHARTVDPTYLSGVQYQSPIDVDPTQSPVEFDMATDTPSRVSISTYTTSQGDVVPQGVAWKGDIIGAGGKNQAREGDLKGDLNFPIIRNNPTVWFVRTRTGTSDDVDTNVQLQLLG